MSRAVISTISALLVALIALQCDEVRAEPTIAIAVPKDVQVDTLFALSREKPNSVSADIAFDIDPDGLPVVADGAAMKILGTSDQLLTLGVLLIDDFAFMRDSSLLLV